MPAMPSTLQAFLPVAALCILAPKHHVPASYSLKCPQNQELRCSSAFAPSCGAALSRAQICVERTRTREIQLRPEDRNQERGKQSQRNIHESEHIINGRRMQIIMSTSLSYKRAQRVNPSTSACIPRNTCASNGIAHHIARTLSCLTSPSSRPDVTCRRRLE